MWDCSGGRPYATVVRRTYGRQRAELERVLEGEVRELAGRVLGHPQCSALDRPAEANAGVRLRGQERMFA